MSQEHKIGLLSVVAIGVGGMVGGGIFAVLGLSVQLAQGGAPLAFLIAGIVALLTTYAYARLSVTFPSRGGTVTFLNKAFGTGVLTGSLNILLLLSYIVMLSLYASAFGSYGATIFPNNLQSVGEHLLISGVIIGITALNFLNAEIVSKAESFIVVFKLAILTIFIVLGISGIQLQKLEPSSWTSPLSLVAGGMIIFLAYEGFELMANTAEDVKDAERTLPRAYYIAVIFVIILYVLIAGVTVGSLSVDKIVSAKEYALAEAAKPFMGQFGFTLITIAAMFSTASAINATIYGTARISYTVAKVGELPAALEKKVWNQPEGLLLICVLTLLVANLFDLSNISTMGSAGFLIIFGAVNWANVRLYRQTQSKRWISFLGAVVCVAALLVLLAQTAKQQPQNLLVVVIMVVLAIGIEFAFCIFSNRSIQLESNSFKENGDKD